MNGAADGLAEATKSDRPMGIGSRSIMASPRFTRVFGAGFLVVGVIFVQAGGSALTWTRARVRLGGQCVRFG
jgi:hypothetical protein